MKVVIQWAVIAVLLVIYAGAMWAMLHPHVSPEYRAFYIDRSASEYRPDHYPATPEQGMDFSRRELPEWVASTYNLYFVDGAGRWSDDNLGNRFGLRLARPFSGDVCLSFTAYAVPWLEARPIEANLGGEQESVLAHGGPAEYQMQFSSLRDAERLEFVLPPGLPRLVERDSHSNDSRRLGISLDLLKLIPGECRKTEVTDGR